MPRRKRYQEDEENHERWLISYADFITLLFAFFVVMYAVSVVNVGKYKVLSDALGDAFGRHGAASTANASAALASPDALPL
ncbi:MAG: flagellar motor protein MotD, partial [Oxalobacteraceae bacterium]